MVLAIATDLFEPDQRGRVMGFIQTAFAASQILGLPAGIYLSNHWDWHAPFLVMVVFVPLGAGLMTVVASFTRSNREAQTWLSVVLLIPLAPIMFAVMNGTRPTPWLMAIPSLSQHLLATDLIRGDMPNPLHVIISVLSTLAVGALLIALAVRLYRRESILG